MQPMLRQKVRRVPCLEIYKLHMSFRVTIEDTGEVYVCKETQHLLGGMVRLGKKGIPSGCHGGGCGVCKIEITNGDYDTKKMSRAHISAAEEVKGIVLACRVFPRSDIKLMVVGKLRKSVLRAT